MNDLSIKELTEAYEIGKFNRDECIIFSQQRNLDEDVLKAELDKIDQKKLAENEERLQRMRGDLPDRPEPKRPLSFQEMEKMGRTTLKPVQEEKQTEMVCASGGIEGFVPENMTAINGVPKDYIELDEMVTADTYWNERQRQKEAIRQAIQVSKDWESEISPLNEKLEYISQEWTNGGDGKPSAYEKQRAEKRKDIKKKLEKLDIEDETFQSGVTHTLHPEFSWTLNNTEDEFLNLVAGLTTEESGAHADKDVDDIDYEKDFDDIDLSDFKFEESKTKKVKETTTPLAGTTLKPVKEEPDFDFDADWEDIAGDVEPDEDDLDYMSRIGPRYEESIKIAKKYLIKSDIEDVPTKKQYKEAVNAVTFELKQRFPKIKETQIIDEQIEAVDKVIGNPY